MNNGSSIRPLRPIGRIPGDSEKLSRIDYAEIARVEKRRALCRTIAIICLLIVAACIYLAQS